jgi:hypothetical protein
MWRRCYDTREGGRKALRGVSVRSWVWGGLRIGGGNLGSEMGV